MLSRVGGGKYTIDPYLRYADNPIRSLLEDAATKMEQTICASNATEKTTGQRSVALSVLFRYPELMQGRVVSFPLPSSSSLVYVSIEDH